MAKLVQRIAEVEAANDALEQRLAGEPSTGAAEGPDASGDAHPMAASSDAHLKRVRTSRQPRCSGALHPSDGIWLARGFRIRSDVDRYQ